MLANELAAFEAGNIVVRNFLKEGHRIFSSFQPKDFMKKLFSEFIIINCQEGETGNSIHGDQDTWIVQKKLQE
jgi:hypothetical protein